MWKDSRIVMLDAETSGLDPKAGHRIIEVGLCVVENRAVVGSWSHLLDPELPSLEPIITKITGLAIDDLIGKPKFHAVADKLQTLMIHAFAVAAYNSPFDEEFYDHEFTRASLKMPIKPWLDPLVWIRNYEGSGKNKLDEVCLRYGIESDGAHRAKADAVMAAKVMLKLMDRLPDDFTSVLALQDLWRRKQDAERKVWLAKKQKAK